jgi:hypothetical protein
MRIDDDGYVIMENLIMFLRTRDPTALEMSSNMCVCTATYVVGDDPSHLPSRPHSYVMHTHAMYGVDYKAYNGYIGTGAGLTLSACNFHGALINALANVSCDKAATHNDDVAIAACLRLVRALMIIVYVKFP